MAVDTRNKRASTIGIFLPVPSVLPNADGSIEDGDRFQVSWAYSGLEIALASYGTVLMGFVTLNVSPNGDVKLRSTMNGDVTMAGSQ